MNIASTVIAIIIILAVLAGAVYFLWSTKDKSKPSYMATPKVKMTKEEKAAIKENKKAETKKK